MHVIMVAFHHPLNGAPCFCVIFSTTNQNFDTLVCCVEVTWIQNNFYLPSIVASNALLYEEQHVINYHTFIQLTNWKHNPIYIA